MAEPASTQEIADGSKCFYQCVPAGMQMAALIYIFNQIRILGGGTDMTPQEIVDASKCYYQCLPRGMEFAALIYLANAFVAAGGSAQMSCGDGAPVAAPTNPALCAIYYDNAAGGVPYFWNVGTAAWN